LQIVLLEQPYPLQRILGLEERWVRRAALAEDTPFTEGGHAKEGRAGCEHPFQMLGTGESGALGDLGVEITRECSTIVVDELDAREQQACRPPGVGFDLPAETVRVEDVVTGHDG